MSDRPYDLLVVSELNVDVVLRGDVTPEFGQVEKLVDDCSVYAGSSGGIFAASAAKMGLRVLYASKVGDDLLGHYMVDALGDAGVDTRLVVIDPAVKTGVGVVLSRGQDRAMLTYLGSISAISHDDVDPEWYSLAKHLHVVSPFLMSRLYPAMPKMMCAAKDGGMTVSLDTNWDPTQEWALHGFFDHLDVFLPNERELLAIAGALDLEQAIGQMAARVPVLVVKRGVKGALAVSNGERVDVPAFSVDVADTTGAGDTFDGGFLSGWLRGEPLERCLVLGTACSALTVTQVGGFVGQPTWEEAASFVEKARAPGL